MKEMLIEVETMIEIVTIIIFISGQYVLLDRRLTKIENDMCWVKKHIKNQTKTRDRRFS